MPHPHISGNFGNVLDPRFQMIFHEQFKQQSSRLTDAFTIETNNGRDTQTYSEVGALTDFEQFDGQLKYDSLSAGFDTVLTPIEFSRGFTVERRLFDTDQHSIFTGQPRSLATAAMRTREGHAARVFTGAFSTDPTFATRTDGLPLCSNAHLTNAPDTSTAIGFDNLGASAFSATALEATRIIMSDFRDDRANRIDVMPDEIWCAEDNREKVWEVLNSSGKVDVDLNNANFNENGYQLKVWQYMNSDDWFVADSTMRRMMNVWTDAKAIEFAMVEDFESFEAKWRGYMVYAHHFKDWRWVFGHDV